MSLGWVGLGCVSRTCFLFPETFIFYTISQKMGFFHGWSSYLRFSAERISCSTYKELIFLLVTLSFPKLKTFKFLSRFRTSFFRNRGTIWGSALLHDFFRNELSKKGITLNVIASQALLLVKYVYVEARNRLAWVHKCRMAFCLSSRDWLMSLDDLIDRIAPWKKIYRSNCCDVVSITSTQQIRVGIT